MDNLLLATTEEAGGGGFDLHLDRGQDSCRPGDLDSTVVCDSRYLTEFPSEEIPDSNVGLLIVNSTTLRAVRAGDLVGEN